MLLHIKNPNKPDVFQLTTNRVTIVRTFIFWALALVITLAAAVYQRTTGPTYPARGQVTIGGVAYDYELIRSQDGNTGAPITIAIADPEVEGVLVYKRYNVNEDWTEVPLQRSGDDLSGLLPHQPPAGKLEYYLRLYKGDQLVTVPRDRVLVIRFKGNVPACALIPHIFLMFAAMLISTRAGLEALLRDGRPRNYALWATALLILGGMVMGPIVQKYAFGSFWTGVPFGWDLTDNKTLIALIGWIIAVITGMKGRSARAYVVGAAILLLLIFSIPHSIMGSELDYETGKVGTSGMGE